MKNLKILLLLFLMINSYAQNLNLRKAILKSDLIIVCYDFDFDTIRINDFTNNTYVKINKIDSILKNRLSTIPKKLTVRKYLDNEDYYSDLITNEGGCIMKPTEANNWTAYTNIFFIRKNGKEYQSFLAVQGIELEKYKKIAHQIRTISKIEHLKNDKERFEKTLDWSIENGLLPDPDFIEYYKQKGITTDTIQYSDQQYKNALQQFQKGKEELLPMVREKYFDEIKAYYLKKMQVLIDKEKLDHNDYYDFYNIVSNTTNTFNDDYNSGDYILNSALTSDKFNDYEKKNIMIHLLKIVTEWE
ncbi:hypothetical protein [Chryseobacterium mulctrae]|uniref:hypothetical protein n=1 Tax=Chryseobacterium mulctrae TaxID=2576777 RepID=UPI001115C064|nr:hypothetical protein [Chryseobacterium mulctrae]